jgi:hypothetical protein
MVSRKANKIPPRPAPIFLPFLRVKRMALYFGVKQGRGDGASLNFGCYSVTDTTGLADGWILKQVQDDVVRSLYRSIVLYNISRVKTLAM